MARTLRNAPTESRQQRLDAAAARQRAERRSAHRSEVLESTDAPLWADWEDLNA